MTPTNLRQPQRLQTPLQGCLQSLCAYSQVFDFPPFLGLLDAHALWHAATVRLAQILHLVDMKIPDL